jgi:hypothetical protein
MKLSPSKLSITNLTLVVTVFLVFRVNDWWLLRLGGVKEKEDFSDLFLTYQLTQCKGNSCAGFIYGDLLFRSVRTLNLDRSDINYIGNVLTIVFILYAYTLVSQFEKTRSKLLLLAIIFGPPTQLLLERMNLDLLLFLMAVLAFRSLHRPYIGILILILGSLIKAYLVIAVFLFILLSYKIIDIIRRTVIILIALAVGVYVSLDYASKAGPYETWNQSFGLPVFGIWIETLVKWDNVNLWLLPSLLVILFVLGRQFEAKVQSGISAISGAGLNTDISLSSVILLLPVGTTMWLFFINFDYRMIFLTIPLAIMFLRTNSTKLFSLVLTVTWLSSTNLFPGIRFAYPASQAIGDILGLFLCLVAAKLSFEIIRGYIRVKAPNWMDK